MVKVIAVINIVEIAPVGDARSIYWMGQQGSVAGSRRGTGGMGEFLRSKD